MTHIAITWNIPKNPLLSLIRNRARANDVETANTGAADAEVQTELLQRSCLPLMRTQKMSYFNNDNGSILFSPAQGIMVIEPEGHVPPQVCTFLHAGRQALLHIGVFIALAERRLALLHDYLRRFYVRRFAESDHLTYDHTRQCEQHVLPKETADASLDDPLYQQKINDVASKLPHSGPSVDDQLMALNCDGHDDDSENAATKRFSLHELKLF